MARATPSLTLSSTASPIGRARTAGVARRTLRDPRPPTSHGGGRFLNRDLGKEPQMTGRAHQRLMRVVRSLARPDALDASVITVRAPVTARGRWSG